MSVLLSIDILPVCKSCTLYKQPYVSAEGEGRIMLIGEAPGEEEARQGRPFVGSSGRYLQSLLKLAGIGRSECYITNVVKCHPVNNRTPTKKQIECCREMLQSEIDYIKPDIIITLGGVAFHHFKPYPISAYHGCKFRLLLPSKSHAGNHEFLLIPMYHPAAAMHQPNLKGVIEDDFRHLSSKPELKPIKGDYCLSGWYPIETGRKMSVDTETTGTERGASLIGAAFGEEGAADYMTSEDALNFLRLERPKQAIFYNAKFDLKVFADCGIYPDQWNQVDDAMVLAYCMNLPILKLKDFVPQELNLIMTRYEEVCPEGGTLADVSPEAVAKYCGSDADGTWRLFDHLWKRASARERKLYEDIDRPIIPILADMEWMGVRLDVEFLLREQDRIVREIDELVSETESRWGLTEKMIGSPKQLGDFVVKELGLPIPKKTPTGQYQTDIEMLYPLRGKHPAIEHILRYKDLAKLRGTYIEGILKREQSGMLYTTFNQCRTASGRLSSSDPNLQVLPHSGGMRKMLVSEEGCSLVSFDDSQIELAIAAHASQDKRLLEIFKNEDVDVHFETGKLMYGGTDPDHRWLGKQANYAATYGGTYRALLRGRFAKFGDRMMSEEKAIEVFERYWRIFPGLKRWIGEKRRFVQENGYIDTLLGRRRYFPQADSRNPFIRDEAMREAINHVPQGTCADVVKLQMQAVYHIWKPILQVHDELVFEIPDTRLKEVIPQLMKAMTDLDLPFKVKVDCAIGKNFGELKEISDGKITS